MADRRSHLTVSQAAMLTGLFGAGGWLLCGALGSTQANAAPVHHETTHHAVSHHATPHRPNAQHATAHRATHPNGAQTETVLAAAVLRYLHSAAAPAPTHVAGHRPVRQHAHPTAPPRHRTAAPAVRGRTPAPVAPHWSNTLAGTATQKTPPALQHLLALHPDVGAPAADAAQTGQVQHTLPATVNQPANPSTVDSTANTGTVAAAPGATTTPDNPLDRPNITEGTANGISSHPTTVAVPTPGEIQGLVDSLRGYLVDKHSGAIDRARQAYLNDLAKQNQSGTPAENTEPGQEPEDTGNPVNAAVGEPVAEEPGAEPIATGATPTSATPVSTAPTINPATGPTTGAEEAAAEEPAFATAAQPTATEPEPATTPTSSTPATPAAPAEEAPEESLPAPAPPAVPSALDEENADTAARQQGAQAEADQAAEQNAAAAEPVATDEAPEAAGEPPTPPPAAGTPPATAGTASEQEEATAAEPTAAAVAPDPAEAEAEGAGAASEAAAVVTAEEE